MRREALRVRDRHGAPFRGGMIEVSVAHHPEQPIYSPAVAGFPRIGYLAEGLPLPVWALSPPFDDATMQPFAERYVYLTNSIAYWAWQCAPSVAPLLRPLARHHTCLLIELRLPPHVSWETPTPLPDARAGGPFTRAVDVTTGTIVLTAGPGIGDVFGSADNAGERELVRQMLGGMRALLPDREQRRWTDDALAAIVDRHVPLGMKKRVLALNSRDVLDLDNRGLPLSPPRVVQGSAMHAITYEMWPRMQARLRMHGQAEQAPKEHWSGLLNALVGHCFDELESLVASLAPEGLLETLVVRHEALVRERALGRLSIPTLAIGLTDVPRVVEGERAGYAQAARAATAARFVIEYVVTRPPTGHAPLSLSTYDRLQALATHIIETGAESDAIHYDLIDSGDAPLSAADLAVKRADYRQAMGTYAAAFAVGETARLTASFADHWPDLVGARAPASPLVVDIDRATAVEWGCGILDLLTFLAEVGNIGRAIHPVVACMDRDELAERLVASLSWPRTRVDNALALLTLGPRERYLFPPEPYAKTDVFPWRYTRALSCLRRPLLSRSRDDKTDIVWGPRHVYTAERHYVDLILSGRLEARTVAMQRVQTDILQWRGHAFNDAVRDLLTDKVGMKVYARFKKIGHVDGLARGLGDVDVLAADTQAKVLWAIECKAFAPARIPYEVQGELARLLVAQPGKRSAAERHERRASYLRAHLADVVAGLALGNGHGWMVKALMVVDVELASLYLRQSPIPLMSFEQFKVFTAT